MGSSMMFAKTSGPACSRNVRVCYLFGYVVALVAG